MKMSYVVVKLLDENADVVTVISSAWLCAEGKKAKMPTIPSHKWYEAVRKHEEPKENFTIQSVHEIMRTAYFEHARNFERMYERGCMPSSDDTIGMGTPPKRPRFPTVRYSPMSVPNRITDTRQYVPSTPTYNTQPSTSAMRKSFPLFNDESRGDGHLVSDKRTGTNSAKLKPVALFNDDFKHSEISASVSNVSPSVAANDNLACLMEEVSRLKTSLNDVRKELRDEFSLIKIRLNGLANNQDTIITMLQTLAEKPPKDLPFPIVSELDMLRIEAKLTDWEFRRHVVEYISKIPGNSVRECVNRLMRQLLTPRYAAELEFASVQANFTFKKSTLHTIICASIAERFKENNVTTETVSVSVRVWLNNARHHRGGVPGTNRLSKKQQSIILDTLEVQEVTEEYQPDFYTPANEVIDLDA